MEIIPNKTQIDTLKLINSKLHFPQNTKARHIFHYTSIGGLEGILKYKTLRFTNIKYMNDKDEIIAGLDSMAKTWNVSEKEKERLRSAFLSHGMQTFVCCFSLEKDSLPMWNYYTKEINSQGYNIEFNDKKLVESILRSNPELNGCYLSFVIVDYSKDNNSEYSQTITNELLSSINLNLSKFFISAAEEAIDKTSSNIDKSSLKDWKQIIEDTEKKKKLNNLPIFFYNGQSCSFEKNPSGDYLYFIKRECFKQEREFRIVITIPDERLAAMKEKGVYKFRIGNGILVPFLELSFSAHVVKSITISPTVQSDLVELSIEDFLKYCEFEVKDWVTFIRHSNVPVRF